MGSREIKSLDQLMDGGVAARFQTELQKVWNNIFDMNTEAKDTRSISITFKFKPTPQRDAATMTADITVKLANAAPMQQTVLMHQFDDGSIQVAERTNQIVGQLDMEGKETIPNVVEFKAAETH